jgi:hypothetical protein
MFSPRRPTPISCLRCIPRITRGNDIPIPIEGVKEMLSGVLISVVGRIEMAHIMLGIAFFSFMMAWANKRKAKPARSL